MFLSISVLALLITIGVSPRTNLDAINLPKFFLLKVGTSLTMFVFLLRFRVEEWNRAKLGIQLCLLVVGVLILSSVFNGSIIDRDSLLGIYGRRFGLLSVLFILLLSLVMYLSTKARHARVFSTVFTLASTVVGLYFIAQTNGYDFAKWSDSYGVANSTLGNPNFLSALAATSLLCSFSTFITVKGTFHKVISILNVPISGFVVFSAASIQGYAITAIGSVLLLNFFLWRMAPIHLRLKVFVASITLTILVIAIFMSDIANFIRNESTLQRRFDYWRAAAQMIAEKPLVGFGWDSFGNWYLRYRDEQAIAAGSGIFTNSPHSLILEIGASSGIVAMAFFSLFVFFVFKSLLTKLFALKADNRDLGITAPIGTIWLGMFLQSFINPVSLPLIVWMFLSGALLLGLQREVREGEYARRSPPVTSTRRKEKKFLNSSIQEDYRRRVKIHQGIVVLSVIPLLFVTNSAAEVYRQDANIYAAIAVVMVKLYLSRFWMKTLIQN